MRTPAAEMYQVSPKMKLKHSFSSTSRSTESCGFQANLLQMKAWAARTARTHSVTHSGVKIITLNTPSNKDRYAVFNATLRDTTGAGEAPDVTNISWKDISRGKEQERPVPKVTL